MSVQDDVSAKTTEDTHIGIDAAYCRTMPRYRQREGVISKGIAQGHQRYRLRRSGHARSANEQQKSAGMGSSRVSTKGLRMGRQARLPMSS
jgi:hypothetical protein